MSKSTSVNDDQNAALTNYLSTLLFGAAMEPDFHINSTAPIPPPKSAVPDAASVVPAREPVDYFIFNVSGLKLALPRQHVLGVVNFADCARYPTPQGVRLGSVLQPEGELDVVDTARLVMPERPVVEPYRLVVLIDEYPYGLACHDIERTLAVKPEDVCWKSGQTKRRWLAGTLIEQRCALLDIDEVSLLI